MKQKQLIETMYPWPKIWILGAMILLLSGIKPGYGEQRNDLPSASSIVQQDMVSGVVVDSRGVTLPGVNVVVKGTTQGTVTDVDGKYQIPVPSSSAILVFSFIGYESLEIAANSAETARVVMAESSIAIGEVVKTALNISRSKKSLGYSVQQVDSKEISISKPQELATALKGKVAGVRVYGTASSTFGDSKIRIRGVNDLGGNGPLFVIDGTPVSHSDIDMSIVESISVLKGPSAAALYGQRAANGVVLVTTKSGSRKGGMHIEISSGVKFETIATFPDVQNEYGQGNTPADGSAYQFPVFAYNPSLHPESWAAWNGQPMVDYSSEMSWGPKMDGQMVRQWYSWYADDSDYGQLTPFSSHPNIISKPGRQYKTI